MKRLPDLAAVLGGLGPGATVVLHSGCAEPPGLARRLAECADALAGLHVITLMPMGKAPYASEQAAARLDVATFFPGLALRAALNSGRARPLRHSLSAIPALFDSGAMHADALLLQVSSPDAQGEVTLGLSVDYLHAVLAQAPLVVAEINPLMPRTHGHTRLPLSRIDWFVDATEPPQTLRPARADVVDAAIARHVATLVHDGAVLQVGIGALPDAVLAQLGHLRHLGLHSGIITDAVQPLIEQGVIDNSRKNVLSGVSVATTAGGTRAFYDFLHDNPALQFHPCSFTHGEHVLAGIERLCAINSALQVDLAGQVNAEQVDGRRVSMPGGQCDFALGASRSPGGVGIVALRSTFGAERKSNIVAALDRDAPVTVPAALADYVVTEHGVAALRGLHGRQRAAALVAVADPSARDALAAAAGLPTGRAPPPGL